MVQKVDKLVALATFLPRNLVFLTGQHSQSEQVAAAALRPACGPARHPSGVQAPQGPCTHFLELQPHQPLARC